MGVRSGVVLWWAPIESELFVGDTYLQNVRRESGDALVREPLRIALGLRAAFHEGYSRRDLTKDLAAGAVVGVVAIPLSMALAMATGVPPQYGLYTAISAGGLTALLGGSRVQVSGPTAAFVVILAPIVAKFGLGGLAVATLMAGIILMIMGLAGLGRLIEFVPFPVTSGFTAGIGVVIATLQIKDFFGLEIQHMPESYVEKVVEIARALPTAHLADAAIGAATLLLLIGIPRVIKTFPAPLIVLPLVTIAAVLLERYVPGFSVATINTRFSYVVDGVTHPGIPQMLPPFGAPWTEPGADGQPLGLSMGLIRALLPSAFAIATLSAIESLLSAVIADGMTGKKHNPDGELMALGTANVFTTFFGGFAATGAIARTAANVRFGARSPIAAITHAMVILLAVLVFAPLLGYLPIAGLAGLLLLVAWNMAEVRHVLYVARIAPRSDVFVLLTCLFLTVIFDMVIAVSVGMMLAFLLFARRMAEVAQIKLVDNAELPHADLVTKGVVVYEIAGPLFFGAAGKAVSSLSAIGANIRTVVFDFRKVPAMDVTGLINLESAFKKLRADRVQIVLAGVGGQPHRALNKAGWNDEASGLRIFEDFDEAIAFCLATIEHPTT